MLSVRAKETRRVRRRVSFAGTSLCLRAEQPVPNLRSLRRVLGLHVPIEASRDRDVLVAQSPTDLQQIHPTEQEQRGARVPQHVRAEARREQPLRRWTTAWLLG